MSENEKKTTRKPDRRLLFGGLFLLLLGLGWTGMQVYDVMTWERASAKVTSVDTVDSGSGSNRSRTYRPRLEFKDHTGRLRRVSPAYTSGQFNFDRGERIPIIYRREDPTHFRITTFTSYWIWPVVAVAFGGLIVVLTIRSRSGDEKHGAQKSSP